MSSVAELIVRSLRDAGVATLFGVPSGGSNLDVIEAATRVGLPFVLLQDAIERGLAHRGQTLVDARIDPAGDDETLRAVRG